MKIKKKRLSKICIIVLCFGVLFVIANSVTYAFAEKTLIDVFFEKEDEKDKRLIMEMIIPDGQSCVIDGYIITLENYAYCSDTKEGYCEFVIENDSVDMNQEYYPDSPISFGFGKEGRFHIYFETGSGSIALDSDIEVKDNIMYLYYYFQITSAKEIDMLYIYDYESGMIDEMDNPKYSSASFQLSNTVPSIKYTSEDKTEIRLSPFSFYLISKDGLEVLDELKVYYTDGTVCELIDSREYGSIIKTEGYSFEDEYGRPDFGLYQHQCTFKELLKLEGIDYIVYNGEKLTVK